MSKKNFIISDFSDFLLGEDEDSGNDYTSGEILYSGIDCKKYDPTNSINLTNTKKIVRITSSERSDSSYSYEINFPIFNIED